MATTGACKDSLGGLCFWCMNSLVEYSDFVKMYKDEKFVPKNPLIQKWFPLYPSPELAGVVADLMGDGNLQGAPRWRFDFCSKSVQELLRFERVLFELFGLRGKIRACTTNMYGTMNYGVNCKPLGRLLSKIGVPFGEKVSQGYPVPQWIVRDKDCFARFVQRYFDCEGTVDLTSKAVSISTFKKPLFLNSGKEFMGQICAALKAHFGIKTCQPFVASRKQYRKDGSFTQGIYLKVKSKDAVNRFAQSIGFETAYKAESLLKLTARMPLLKFV